jgi:hypothetical protein
MLWVGLVGGPDHYGGMGGGDGPDVGGAGLMDGIHGGNGDSDIQQQQQGRCLLSALPEISKHDSRTTEAFLRALLFSLFNLHTSRLVSINFNDRSFISLFGQL